MKKNIWIDTETTGLSPAKNGIIQIAMLVCNKKGKVIDILNIKMKPFKGCIYDEEALSINGETDSSIATYMSEKSAFKHIIEFLDKHIDRFDKADKFTPHGYNVRFDIEFLQALFLRNENEFYGAYFSHYDVDTYALVKILDLEGELDGKLCKKLGAICNIMDVDLASNSHDALEDIRATRKLHNKLVKKYLQ